MTLKVIGNRECDKQQSRPDSQWSEFFLGGNKVMKVTWAYPHGYDLYYRHCHKVFNNGKVGSSYMQRNTCKEIRSCSETQLPYSHVIISIQTSQH